MSLFTNLHFCGDMHGVESANRASCFDCNVMMEAVLSSMVPGLNLRYISYSLLWGHKNDIITHHDPCMNRYMCVDNRKSIIFYAQVVQQSHSVHTTKSVSISKTWTSTAVYLVAYLLFVRFEGVYSTCWPLKHCGKFYSDWVIVPELSVCLQAFFGVQIQVTWTLNGFNIYHCQAVALPAASLFHTRSIEAWEIVFQSVLFHTAK